EGSIFRDLMLTPYLSDTFKRINCRGGTPWPPAIRNKPGTKTDGHGVPLLQLPIKVVKFYKQQTMNSKLSLTFALAIPALLCCLGSATATTHELYSPDQKIQVIVHVDERITYDVRVNGKAVLENSSISMDVDHNILGKNAKVNSSKTDLVDRTIEPAVKQKFAKVREHYNELRLSFEGNFALTFRAYDEGVAYRFEISLPQAEVKVYGEEASFNFAGNYNV